MRHATLTLGIDLGTSAVKVAAVEADATLAGEASADFDTRAAQPLEAEQAPDDWLEATGRAMRRLDEGLRSQDPDWAKRIGAIGLTGQLPTLVCLGDHGPVARAITWRDGRADAWAAMRLERGAHYVRTGMPIDGRYLAPMWQFHFADRAGADGTGADGTGADRRGDVRAVLSAKDYLVHVLTGALVTEPSTAAGYGVYDLKSGCFARDLCEFWGLPMALLPKVQPANSLAGILSEAGAALLGLPAGIAVSTGAADSVCAAYSMAGLDERIASVSFGSSAVILGASAAPRLDPKVRYLLTPHVEEAWYGREMDLLATGAGYRWLSTLFDWDEGQLDRYAAQSLPGSRGLYFAPYLAGGEQGALWNPRLRGALRGLALNHSRADIARAYLEGVFFEVKRCVEVLAEARPIESVRVAGKIVHAAGNLQMLADILDRPVAKVADQSPAAMGAATLARRLLGAKRPDRGRSPRATSPDAPAARAYASVYGRYLEQAAQCE
jgi:xylulokinase